MFEQKWNGRKKCSQRKIYIKKEEKKMNTTVVKKVKKVKKVKGPLPMIGDIITTTNKNDQTIVQKPLKFTRYSKMKYKDETSNILKAFLEHIVRINMLNRKVKNDKQEIKATENKSVTLEQKTFANPKKKDGTLKSIQGLNTIITKAQIKLEKEAIKYKFQRLQARYNAKLKANIKRIGAGTAFMRTSYGAMNAEESAAYSRYRDSLPIKATAFCFITEEVAAFLSDPNIMGEELASITKKYLIFAPISNTNLYISKRSKFIGRLVTYFLNNKSTKITKANFTAITKKATKNYTSGTINMIDTNAPEFVPYTNIKRMLEEATVNFTGGIYTTVDTAGNVVEQIITGGRGIPQANNWGINFTSSDERTTTIQKNLGNYISGGDAGMAQIDAEIDAGINEILQFNARVKASKPLPKKSKRSTK